MARPVATVRPVKRNGRWVFLPTCALSRALCRLAKRAYLDTEDLKLIVHPDLIDIRVGLQEPDDRDINHWLTYPVQH
jgi:hypothetical protein